MVLLFFWNMALSQSRWGLGHFGLHMWVTQSLMWVESMHRKAGLMVSFACSDDQVCSEKSDWSRTKVFSAETRIDSRCPAIEFQSLYCWISHFEMLLNMNWEPVVISPSMMQFRPWVLAFLEVSAILAGLPIFAKGYLSRKFIWGSASWYFGTYYEVPKNVSDSTYNYSV